MKNLNLFILTLLLATAPAWAQNKEMRVYRNGEMITWYGIDVSQIDSMPLRNDQIGRPIQIYSNGNIAQTFSLFITGRIQIDSITFVPYNSNDGVIINGIVWAKRNVAAFRTFASTPEDPGMLYQWNRPTAYPVAGESPISNWNYIENVAPEDGRWEKANDPCPAGWRVPTPNEQLSLQSVSYEWIEKSGMRFTDKTGNSIFLPAVGSCGNAAYYSDIDMGIDYGGYWSNSGDTYYKGQRLYFQRCSFQIENCRYPYCTSTRDQNVSIDYGLSVRCVADVENEWGR